MLPSFLWLLPNDLGETGMPTPLREGRQDSAGAWVIGTAPYPDGNKKQDLGERGYEEEESEGS